MTKLICQAGGVLLLASLAACGSKSTPDGPSNTPTNHNPTVGSFSVSPSFGISQLTSFLFNATATDPDGNPVSYQWRVGSLTFNTQNVTTMLTGDGQQAVTLTVSDGQGGSATSTGNLTLGTMTGTWTVTLNTTNAPCGSFTATLTQTGTTVTGTFAFPTTFCNATAGSEGRTDPAEPGTIDAQGNVQIRIKVDPFIDFTIRGVMDNTGRKVTGGAFSSGFNGDDITMTKQ
jgi:PKD domain